MLTKHVNMRAKPTTRSTRSTVVEELRLLTLSSELRNLIYTFAIADATATADTATKDDGGLFELIHPSRVQGSGSIPTSLRKDWSQLHRCYLGLTQACRQTRSEFVPLYMPLYTPLIDDTEEPRYFVTLSAIVTYVDTFLLPYAENLEEVEATIPFMTDSDPEIILDPLFDLLHPAPGRELTLYDPHDRSELTSEDFRYLVSLHTGSEWAQYLWYRLNCISKIEIQTVKSTVCSLNITMKAKSAEDWMFINGYECSDGFKEWVERVGLFSRKFLIDVEVGERSL